MNVYEVTVKYGNHNFDPLLGIAPNAGVAEKQAKESQMERLSSDWEGDFSIDKIICLGECAFQGKEQP